MTKTMADAGDDLFDGASVIDDRVEQAIRADERAKVLREIGEKLQAPAAKEYDDLIRADALREVAKMLRDGCVADDDCNEFEGSAREGWITAEEWWTDHLEQLAVSRSAGQLLRRGA